MKPNINDKTNNANEHNKVKEGRPVGDLQVWLTS